MKKVYMFCLLICGFSSFGFSQTLSSDRMGNLRDMYGDPVMTKNHTDTKGTPYLYDEWHKGKVKISDGTTFKEVDLMYDLVDGVLIFKDPQSGQPLTFRNAVNEFVLHRPQETLIFKKGFSQANDTFFHVLVDGRVQLLKKYSKVVKESREFNSATTTKAFNLVTDWFLVRDGNMVKIRRVQKDILAHFDNTSELEDFIRQHKLNLKSDADLIKLVSYYNSSN